MGQWSMPQELGASAHNPTSCLLPDFLGVELWLQLLHNVVFLALPGLSPHSYLTTTAASCTLREPDCGHEKIGIGCSSPGVSQRGA